MKTITFSYHRLQVRFFAQADVSLDAWVGAVLRNNFLAQAAAVIDDQGISLFQHLNTLPIAASHPNWQSLQGGFPKPCGLTAGIFLQEIDREPYMPIRSIHLRSCLLPVSSLYSRRLWRHSIKCSKRALVILLFLSL